MATKAAACYSEKEEEEIQRCIAALKSSSRVYVEPIDDVHCVIWVPRRMLDDPDFVHALAGVHCFPKSVSLCDYNRFTEFCSKQSYALQLGAEDDPKCTLNGVVMGGINIVVGFEAETDQLNTCLCGKNWKDAKRPRTEDEAVDEEIDRAVVKFKRPKD